MNQGLATLRNVRCLGGSIVMMVCIASKAPFSPRARRSATSRGAGMMPLLLTNRSGCFEISQMCAWRVTAQNGTSTGGSHQWSGDSRRSRFQVACG